MNRVVATINISRFVCCLFVSCVRSIARKREMEDERWKMKGVEKTPRRKDERTNVWSRMRIGESADSHAYTYCVLAWHQSFDLTRTISWSQREICPTLYPIGYHMSHSLSKKWMGISKLESQWWARFVVRMGAHQPISFFRKRWKATRPNPLVKISPSWSMVLILTSSMLRGP